MGRFSMSTAQPPIAPDDADRSTRLMVAGMLACLCGLFAVMMAALTILRSTVSHPRGHATNPPVDIKSTVFFLLAAVAFVWLGIGLAKARRWAWTLTVVLSWMWLIFGALGFATVMFFMSQMKDEAVVQHGEAKVASSGAMTAAMIGVGVFGACIAVLMPVVFLMLCHSKSVRATCWKRNPKPRWTDRCPMPVLALTIFLASSIWSMLGLMAYKRIPMFGMLVSGASGAALIVVIVLVLGWLAWGTYRLQDGRVVGNAVGWDCECLEHGRHALACRSRRRCTKRWACRPIGWTSSKKRASSTPSLSVRRGSAWWSERRGWAT